MWVDEKSILSSIVSMVTMMLFLVAVGAGAADSNSNACKMKFTQGHKNLEFSSVDGKSRKTCEYELYGNKNADGLLAVYNKYGASVRVKCPNMEAFNLGWTFKSAGSMVIEIRDAVPGGTMAKKAPLLGEQSRCGNIYLDGESPADLDELESLSGKSQKCAPGYRCKKPAPALPDSVYKPGARS